MRFDPLYRDITLHYLAEARVSLGQFDAAVAALKQRLERNPNAQTSLALLATATAISAGLPRHGLPGRR